MPKLSTAQKKNAATNKEKVAGDLPFVLRYEHFSIVMNKKRRLAFFTATNIDGASSKDFDRTTRGDHRSPRASMLTIRMRARKRRSSG
jgi:endonuclease G